MFANEMLTVWVPVRSAQMKVPVRNYLPLGAYRSRMPRALR